MSVSDEVRREDKRRTLCLMVEHVGDHSVRHVAFEPTEAGFTEVLQTTWRELIDQGLLDDKMSAFGHPRFRLTSRGWLRGLAFSGALDEAAFRKRCTQLARALKAVVKGRQSHYDEFVGVNALAAENGLPEGWIHNALEARLLEVVFPNDRWDAQLDPESRNTVRVSPIFGLNHLFDEE
jgi:hypothetical protein